MDCVHPPAEDEQLSAEVEDRLSGSWHGDLSEEEDRETDLDLAAWLAARETELEEQRFALYDMEEERW